MSFYSLIEKKFKFLNVGDEEYFKSLDIVEYAVLEATGYLSYFKELPLKVYFLQNNTGNLLIKKPASMIQFGFHLSVDDPKKSKLKKLVNKVAKKAHITSYHSYNNAHNKDGMRHNLIFHNDYITYALKQSSLFMAAEDLSRLDLEKLILLNEKLKNYYLYDLKLAQLTQVLEKRVSDFINKNYTDEQIKQVKNLALAKVKWLSEIKKQFNLTLSELKKQCSALSTQTFIQERDYFSFLNFAISPRIIVGHSKAPRINEKYFVVNSAYLRLKTTLIHSKRAFFESPSAKNFQIFKKNCLVAIKEAKKQFTAYPDVWCEIHPIIRKLLGVLAGITIIPAFVVHNQSKNGYFATFFGEPKSDLLHAVESFEQTLNHNDQFFSKELSYQHSK